MPRDNDWIGGLLLVVFLIVLIAAPQILWWAATGVPMMPDVTP